MRMDTGVWTRHWAREALVSRREPRPGGTLARQAGECMENTTGRRVGQMACARTKLGLAELALVELGFDCVSDFFLVQQFVFWIFLTVTIFHQ